MAGSKVLEDIELIFEDIGGGRGGGRGGNVEPPTGGGGGEGGENRRPRPQRSEPGRQYSVAIKLGMVSITMFFLGLITAFLVLRVEKDWIPVHLPSILWANTLVLLISSVTIEKARGRLANGDLGGFHGFWRVTTLLGILFLLGQLIAWLQLVHEGIFVASNRASSFFYIFTGLHGVHLLGGVCALLYVLLRRFERAQIGRTTAARVVAYYWHFMDGLWVVLMGLLYLAS
jgi:cytochrome c oxidase subunit 3